MALLNLAKINAIEQTTKYHHHAKNATLPIFYRESSIHKNPDSQELGHGRVEPLISTGKITAIALTIHTRTTSIRIQKSCVIRTSNRNK